MIQILKNIHTNSFNIDGVVNFGHQTIIGSSRIVQSEVMELIKLEYL